MGRPYPFRYPSSLPSSNRSESDRRTAYIHHAHGAKPRNPTYFGPFPTHNLPPQSTRVSTVDVELGFDRHHTPSLALLGPSESPFLFDSEGRSRCVSLCRPFSISTSTIEAPRRWEDCAISLSFIACWKFLRLPVLVLVRVRVR